MANEIEFKPKFRISLLETNGAIISDRLVDAYTELNAGPKAVHMGPVRVEITLTSQQDIDAFKNYLDQLRGNLPLRETTGRGRPSTGSAANKAIETPREDILNDVQQIIADGKNQQQTCYSSFHTFLLWQLLSKRQLQLPPCLSAGQAGLRFHFGESPLLRRFLRRWPFRNFCKNNLWWLKRKCCRNAIFS